MHADQSTFKTREKFPPVRKPAFWFAPSQVFVKHLLQYSLFDRLDQMRDTAPAVVWREKI